MSSPPKKRPHTGASSTFYSLSISPFIIQFACLDELVAIISLNREIHALFQADRVAWRTVAQNELALIDTKGESTELGFKETKALAESICEEEGPADTKFTLSHDDFDSMNVEEPGVKYLEDPDTPLIAIQRLARFLRHMRHTTEAVKHLTSLDMKPQNVMEIFQDLELEESNGTIRLDGRDALELENMEWDVYCNVPFIKDHKVAFQSMYELHYAQIETETTKSTTYILQNDMPLVFRLDFDSEKEEDEAVKVRIIRLDRGKMLLDNTAIEMRKRAVVAFFNGYA